MKKEIECPKCDGYGEVNSHSRDRRGKQCPRCDGRGYVIRRDDGGGMRFVAMRDEAGRTLIVDDEREV